jgi:hypothetical protein
LIHNIADGLVSDELVTRYLDCEAGDVVYVKSVATAYDGLCCMFSVRRSGIWLAAPRGREAELDLLVNDLMEEFAARRLTKANRKK